MVVALYAIHTITNAPTVVRANRGQRRVPFIERLLAGDLSPHGAVIEIVAVTGRVSSK